VLNVTSGQGCKDDTVIVVNRIRLEPKANFTSDSVSICASQQVRFIDRSLIGSAPLVSWEWNFGDGQIFSPGQIPPPHLYVTANTYQVTLKIQDSYGCTNVSAPKSFIVYPYPIISAGNDTVLLEGGQIVLNATASGNDLRYLWEPPLSLSSTTILNPMVSGLTDDITYNLTVVARGGCTKTDKVEVTLLKSPQVPNTFSPNNDGVNDNWVIQYLDSYPNCHIQVFNRQGQLVYESNQYIPPGWNGSYRGKSLPFGTYYYIIEPGSGRKPITGYVTLIK
jgi:gliding motility-associated-like protein